jgi:hypothetical protein
MRFGLPPSATPPSPAPALPLAPRATAALLLAAAGPAWAGSLKDLDKREGFRDLAFGQVCGEIEGFKGNTGAVKEAVKAGMGAAEADPPFRGMLQYMRQSDELRVGAAELLDIRYTCYMDQLMAVQVVAFGEPNLDPLRDALIEAYGEPTSADAEQGRWAWAGKKVALTLQIDPITRFSTATWASARLLQAKADNDLAQKRAAVNDL